MQNWNNLTPLNQETGEEDELEKERKREEEMKNVLFKNSRLQKEEEEKRNRLINELGDNLSNKQIFYSDTKELEDIKNNLKSEAQDKLKGGIQHDDFKSEIQDDSKNETQDESKSEISDELKSEILDELKSETQDDSKNETQDELKSETEDESTSDTQNKLKSAIAVDDKPAERPRKQRPSSSFGIDYDFKNINDVQKNTQPLKNDSQKNISEKIGDFAHEKGEKIKDGFKKISDKTIKPAANRLFDFTATKASEYLKEHPEVKEKMLNLSPKLISSQIGKSYGTPQHKLAQKAFGPDTAGMLDISHSKIVDKTYLKDAVQLENFADKRLGKYQKVIGQKIKEQFKDYTNIDPSKVSGNYFKANSEPSKRIAQSSYVTDFIKNNKNVVLDCKNQTLFDNPKYKNKSFGINFKEGDLHYAIGLSRVLDMKYEKNGNLRIILDDTNDYNDEEPKLIQAGRSTMMKGELEGKFSMWELLIPKEEVDKILR